MATSQVAFLPSEADLRYAFEQREFEVFYQPIVALQTGRLAAIEALMRWRHPDHGLLSAGRFIDVAEKTEFIVPLSEWIQHAVCAQIQAWSSAGLTVPIVGINMTTRQFRSGYFRAHLQAILNQTGVEPGQLAIEIHSDNISDPDVANTVLPELSTLGVALWLDDFGVGTSPLKYLVHYPFSVLKIDLSFVWNMAEDPRWARLVTGIIGLAHHLGLQAVAEGVTKDAQIALLDTYGCDMVQGWYVSPPVSAAEMTAMLQEGRRFGDAAGDVRAPA